MKWRYDFTLNETQNAIMEYLTEELGNSARFISYGKIGKKVGKSRTVCASIEHPRKGEPC